MLRGIIFIVFGGVINNIPFNLRVVFGIFLIAYGVFRFFRHIKKIQNEKEET